MTTLTKAQRQAHADPVAVDPKHYKVEMENDQVRALRITYGPGLICYSCPRPMPHEAGAGRVERPRH